jgi:hypothetical protein
MRVSHGGVNAASLSSMEHNVKPKRETLSLSGRGYFDKPRGSKSTKIIVPMYVNVTGPGDYNIPGFADRTPCEGTVDSNKRTAPSYTLAPKTK